MRRSYFLHKKLKTALFNSEVDVRRITENKEKLHAMIDSITSDGTVECLETFIRLFLEKWGGASRE